MTIQSLGQTFAQNPQQPTTAPAAADQPALEPSEKVTFQVDPSAPHRLIIPADGKPLDPHPVSGSKTARYIVSGTIVGGMSGGYMALGLLSAYPGAAMGVALGTAIMGGLAGYLASRGK